MLQLSHEAFARAHHFLMTKGRPLERGLFAYHFEGAPPDAALVSLKRFRNRDGGFGRALEPDLRTPLSSALATADALATLQALGCPADEPLVRGAVQWLLSAYDEGTAVWRVVPEGASDHPHAPWWHDDGESLARTFDDFLVIPRTRIVALFYHYAEFVPADWLAALAERTVAQVTATEPQRLGGGGDGFRSAMALARAPQLPEHLRDRLLPWLCDVVAPAIVAHDSVQWASYTPQPLKLAPDPDSPVAPLLWDDLQRNLDYQIEHQTPKGCWEPNWTWGDSYPDVWPRARQEWCGRLTLETLTNLRAYGRIEE